MKKIILSIFVFAVSFSTVSGATVISGEVGGSGGSQVVDYGKPVTMTFSTKTNKRTYDLGESINIKISAKADGPTTLKFSSGCQVNYQIKEIGGDIVYNFIAAALCIQATTEAKLPVEWEFIHKTEDRPLSPGQYELIAEVLGYGQALAKFAVAADGVVPDLTDQDGTPSKLIEAEKAKEIAVKILVSEGIPADDYNVVLYEKTTTTPAFYEVSAVKDVKILKFFNAKMTIEARILASDGSVIQVHKPWWAIFVL